MTETRRRKLIEVSIPLDAINKASAREKSIRHGHPSTLHLWWARRPLAACRAVLFAQLVDDPSAWPDRFATEEDQRRERERLHKVIEALVPWEASANEHILNSARWEIARSIAWGNGEEPPAKSSPAAVLAYLQQHAPPVYDPFCGGGAIPLEAQRLGLRAFGSDLNPVAALISKALVEIPPKFAERPPINPDRDPHRAWKGAEGLAEDVRYYGAWMRDEAEKRIGHLYPNATLGDGTEATVIAWLWVRTVASPDPVARGAHVPLVSSFMLSTKKKKVWIEVLRDSLAKDGWRFVVKSGQLSAEKETAAKLGTKSGKGQAFVCVLTGGPIERRYIQAEGKAGRLGTRLLGIVADSGGGRIYLPATDEHATTADDLQQYEDAILEARNTFLSGTTPTRAMITGGVCSAYGLSTWGHLFTSRQLLALITFSDLVIETRDRVLSECLKSGLPRGTSLADGGTDAVAYADAIATYLAFVVDKMANLGSTLTSWMTDRGAFRETFARQALPMTWDFAEANFFSPTGASCNTMLDKIAKTVSNTTAQGLAEIVHIDATTNSYAHSPAIFSTDPPYYDNIGYAELSDFFYVWLRRSLRFVWPDLFRRMLTPKEEELVATPFRHGGKEAAERHFMAGMFKALQAINRASSEGAPTAIYYAFKQSEVAEEGLTSPGWATFLHAVSAAGYAVDGTWPIRTESSGRIVALGSNALASSIVLVCRRRLSTAPVTTRRELIARIKREMPQALQKIKEAGVGPVDMAQSALGPGMGIFTSYSKVLEPDDSEMSVRTAIALINEVREEILGEEDAHYDSETRFCLDWFQAFGIAEGKSGDAINMANAYNLGLTDLEQAGVFSAKGGRAQLLPRSNMPGNWRPSVDRRLTHWECTQHLIRVLQSEEGGTAAAAALIADMSPEDAEAARALAYRLYDICEKKGWAQDAQAYNLLAEEFPHLEQAALDIQPAAGPPQGALDFGEAHS